MLAVTDLNVHYGMHEALSGVNLEIARDEIVVILGANGAGKSTLLSAIAGNCVGEVNGQIVLDGEQLLTLDAAQIVEHGIAFVPEGRGVFADLSVEENLQLGSYTQHARRSEDANLQHVMSLFPKLEERKKQIVRTMSGGEQQMVAIGRALMSAPSILMLDEPSLGLSPLLCKELFQSLMQVRESGVGILLVEQNAKQSLSIADRGYLLGNGKILGHDTAERLLSDSAVQAAYLGGALASQRAVPTIQKSASTDEHTQDKSSDVSALSITPRSAHMAAQSVSSDSLLDDDIDELVARASASASQRRELDASLPLQVVKLSTNKSSTSGSPADVPGRRPEVINTTTSVPEGPLAVDSANSQDEKVQALLAEFEEAAKKAAGIANGTEVTSSAKTRTPELIERHDDLTNLPHIPVYKKSPVTVYRRDGRGKLRKQD